LEGWVMEAPGWRPIAGATVSVGRYEVRTNAEGHFSIGPLSPDATLLVKAPGYERRQLAPREVQNSIALRPKTVKAAYLSYYGVGSDRAQRVFDLLDRTELNAVVIDVKGDRGFTPYPSRVPLAIEAGALGPVRIDDFEKMLLRLKANGIYTIARIVTFKDNVLARYRPDWAVIDARTGQPWIDYEQLAWLDPFREEAWQYIIDIAREAALMGFDEIQFDYLRFPSDGSVGATRYSNPNTQENRLRAITSFLARVRRELAPLGVFLAGDIFGYTGFLDDDSGIGQRVEELAHYLDYLCPMVYPSSYREGIPGYRIPVAHPYEIVLKTLQLIRERSAHTAVKIRPWLQSFRDYAFDRRTFGVTEIRAQIRAAMDAGATGWMLWNPRSRYTEAALHPSGQ
ncbi:MAG: putative glycoside hydrolase, partial [Anaerolineae bacterium]